jgi:hypothetical protein
MSAARRQLLFNLTGQKVFDHLPLPDREAASHFFPRRMGLFFMVRTALLT